MVWLIISMILFLAFIAFGIMVVVSHYLDWNSFDTFLLAWGISIFTSVVYNVVWLVFEMMKCQ